MKTESEIIELLEERIPKEAIYEIDGFEYVSGEYTIDRLNHVFPLEWSWRNCYFKVEERHTDDKDRWRLYVSCFGELHVQVREMGVDLVRVGEACGSGMSKDFGKACDNAFKDASTSALKRAARTLGGSLGLQLYRADGVRWGAVGQLKALTQLRDEHRMFAEAIDKAEDQETIARVAVESRGVGLTQEEKLDLTVRARRRAATFG